MSFFKPKIRRARFWWRLTGAYIRRYKYWILGSVTSIVIVTFTLYKLYTIVSQGNVVNVGYVGNYSLQTIPAEFLSLATQPLISTDTSGRPIPSLASHWTVSPDGKTYVVFLKDNLKWHDGSSVNAKDISVAIEGVNIVALNSQAIEFNLPNAFSSFLLVLDKPVFKTKSFYGTGNFRITQIDQVDGFVKRISLTPNSNKLPRVNIKFYPTEDQAKKALIIGDVKSLSVTEAKEFEDWPNLNVKKQVDQNEIVTIFFNNSQEVLGSKEMRQALIYAINRTEFDGLPSDGPISPNSWAFNPNLKKYEYNTAKARELIAKSQIINPKITLSYTPSYKPLAEIVKKDWEAVGIGVDLKEEAGKPTGFQAFLTADILSKDPDEYALWHSSQTQTNITGYKNVKIDKLLEDARTISDEKQRKVLYEDFQRFLIDDAPAAFLYYPYKYQINYKNATSLISKLPK